MRFLLLLLGSLTMASPAWCGTVTFNLTQPQDDVQTSAGKRANNPISPGISLGPHFSLTDKWKLATELGYIYNQISTNDRYGGKPKVETFYLLYDLSTPVSESVQLRFGLGTFIKRIKADGGTVTIPNGAGTATAYKPSGTSTSYTGSINLGGEWFFSESVTGDFFKNYRLFSELFVFEPLQEKTRLITLQVGIGANL